MRVAPAQIGLQVRKPGHIAARSRQATDQPSPYRVSSCGKDDRDRRSHLFNGDNRRGPCSDDDIDLLLSKLVRKLGIAIVASSPPAKFDRDIAPIDPVELAQPILKRGNVRAPDCRRGCAEEADRGDLRGC